jgi:ribose transport system substrate-binding protein
MSATKRFTALGAAGLMLIGLAACTSTPGGSSSSSGAPITVGGVLYNIGDPYWATMMCGADEAAKAANVTMNWKNTTDLDLTKVTANLNALKLLQPDAIIAAGTGSASNNIAITDFMKAGQPVVLAGGSASPRTELQDVGAEAIDATAFGEYVTDHIGTSGSVGILGAVAGYQVAVDRYQPLIDDLKKSAPGVTVLPVQYDQADRTKAAAITTSLIANNPDLKAIYAITGPAGSGAASAIKAAGKTGEIQLYSFGGDPELVAQLRTGEITGLNVQNTRQIGRDAVKAVVAYLAANPGKKPVPASGADDIKAPVMVVTKENVDSPEVKDFLYTGSASCE